MFAGFRAGLACLASLSVASGATEVRVIDQIVARVNGGVITASDIAIAGESQTLRDQIDQLLLAQRARDLGINADADLARRIAEIQLKSGIADADGFHEWLSGQTKMRFEDFGRQLKDRILAERAISQEVGPGIVVSSAEIERWYEEHKSDFIREESVVLREIRIVPENGSPEAWASAEKLALSVQRRARDGKIPFTQLVHTYSGAETAQDDGRLPPFRRGELRREIEEAVFSRSKGYVSDPFRTEIGYAIYLVDDHIAAGQAPLDDVRGAITERLYRTRMDPAVRTYLTKLREKAFLRIRAGYIDEGAAPGKDTSWKDAAVLKPETVAKEDLSRRKKKLLRLIPR